jgi:asparagine synthase (glutamine-hydrolysing)
MLLALGDPERYYLILRNVWDDDAGQWANVYGATLRDRGFVFTHSPFDSYFADDARGALERVLWAEFNTKMVEDFLANEDRTSMAHGLEVRVPFLDRDLVRFAFSIPIDLKIQGNETKRIFRKALTGFLPAHTLEKKKWGFSFNPYYQFQKDLRGVAEKILTRERIQAQGFFNYGYLRQILDHPPHPRLRWHYFFLWNLVGFQIWYRMFIEGDLKRPSFELETYLGV